MTTKEKQFSYLKRSNYNNIFSHFLQKITKKAKILLFYIFIDFCFMNKGGNWSYFRFIIEDENKPHVFLSSVSIR